MTMIKTIVGACAAIFCGLASAKDVLYVVNNRSGTLSAISIPEHKLIGTIPVIGEKRGIPDDVIGSPDGTTLYVNVKVAEKTPDGFKGDAGEIVAISSATGKVQWRLATDGQPHHLSLSGDGKELFVPIFDRAYVAAIDTSLRKVSRQLDATWGMHGTRTSADGKRLYAGSLLTGEMYVIDIAKNELVRRMSFGEGEWVNPGVRPFTVTRDEVTLYAQLSGLHGFVAADLRGGTVKRIVRHPGLSTDYQYPRAFPFSVDHGLELSPDEKYLVAAGTAMNKVFIYSHPQLTLIRELPTVADANWVTFSPDGQFVYVSGRKDNKVAIISMRSMSEVTRVDTAGEGSSRMRIVNVPVNK